MRVALAVLAALLLASVPAFAQVDFSGQWRSLLQEDVGHRIDQQSAGGPGAGPGAGGPRIGDYTGLPINAAARMKAEAWDPRLWVAAEHQTIFQPGAFWVFAGAATRIATITDNTTEGVVALEIDRAAQGGTTARTIWMDGRPHPPAHAAHTWQGFATGVWQGNTLVVTTTHLKAGFIRRNGVPTSDKATLTEYWVRRGSYMTIFRIVEDPIYLDEPFVTSSTWWKDPLQRLPAPPPSTIVEEIRGQHYNFVPHFLPGTNPHLKEFAEAYRLPYEATRGGRETAYPEYQKRLKELMARGRSTN
ncbi:MAG: hypothetical protein FJW14_02030 [Acidimicrobiia bacterium]|nr:hypothetical protein [Acidimicrobiia bacterium]